MGDTLVCDDVCQVVVHDIWSPQDKIRVALGEGIYGT